MGVQLDSATVEIGLDGNLYTAMMTDAPLAWWRFAEFLGSTAGDSGSGGHDGTYAGSPTLGARGLLPEGGTAVTFDGSTQYVDMGDIGAFAFTTAFSVEAVFQTTTTAVSDPWLIGKSDVSYNGWRLFFDSSGGADPHLRFLAGDPSAVLDVTANILVTDGVPHHVAVTWDGTTDPNGLKIYIDGVFKAQATAVGPPSTPATPLRIARASYGTVANLAATVQHVALYASVLSPDRIAVHAATLLWTDITADVVGEVPLTISYGLTGNGPMDRIAGSGTLTFALRNDAGNSGAMQGYYSPNHASVRSGFTHGIPVRVTLTKTTDREKFWGWIYEISPAPGRYLSQRVAVTAHDFMYRLAEVDIQTIVPQVGKTEQELIGAVLEALPGTVQPMEASLDTGADTFAYAFNDFGEGVKALTAISRSVLSAWGKFFVTGDGTATYRNRTTPFLLTSAVTFADDMIGLRVPSSRDNVFDWVRVTHHPTTLGATDTEVLYALPEAMPFTAGEVKTLFLPYSDPSVRDTLVGGTDFQDPPVSGTDWAAFDNADGTGTNRTSSYTITASYFATVAQYVITNGGAGASYLTTLMVRGRGIYNHGAITQESKSASPNRPLVLDLPYQNEANAALAIGEFIRAEYESIVDQVDELTFIPQESSAFLLAALDREPGDVVTITETVTGLVAITAVIHGVNLVLHAHWLDCRWTMAPKLVGTPWVLDESELDTETIPGVG